MSLSRVLQNLVLLSWRKHSFMYQSLSITTTPEPLSAGLMTMSFRLLSSLQACRSRAVRLSRTGLGLKLSRSCSTASKKVSSAGSLWGGGVQVPLGRNGLGLD